jgi:hypothetical protein
MKVTEAIAILEQYNRWRRDNEGIEPMPNPNQVGIAIDVLLNEVKK